MKEFIIGDGEWCKYPHELMKGKPQTQQMVMLYLLSHRHNKTGACFPSSSTLAKEIGLKTKKPVQNALKALENDGLVVRTPCFKQDGGRSSDRYTLAIKFIQGAGEEIASNQKKSKQKKDKKKNITSLENSDFSRFWDYCGTGNRLKALNEWCELGEILPPDMCERWDRYNRICSDRFQEFRVETHTFIRDMYWDEENFQE